MSKITLRDGAEKIWAAYKRKRGHKAKALQELESDILRYKGDWKAILALVQAWVRNKESEEPNLNWWPNASTFFHQRLWETDSFADQMVRLDVEAMPNVGFIGPDKERAIALTKARRIKEIDGRYYEVSAKP